MFYRLIELVASAIHVEALEWGHDAYQEYMASEHDSEVASAAANQAYKNYGQIARSLIVVVEWSDSEITGGHFWSYVM